MPVEKELQITFKPKPETYIEYPLKITDLKLGHFYESSAQQYVIAITRYHNLSDKVSIDAINLATGGGGYSEYSSIRFKPLPKGILEINIP